MHIMITKKCNRACDYCFVQHVMGDDQLSFEDFKKYIDYLIKYDIKAMSFVGGEPTIHPEINNFLIYAREKMPSLDIGIISNGLFDQDIFAGVEVTKQFKISLGRPLNDMQRAKVVENATFLRENRINFYLGLMLNEEEFDIEDLITLIKKVRPPAITLRLPMPNLPKTNKFIYPFTRQFGDRIFRFIKKIEEFDSSICISNDCFLPLCIFNEEQREYLLSKNIIKTCISPTLILDNNLNVGFCPLFEESITNIGDTPLSPEDIQKKANKSYIKLPHIYSDECLDCKYYRKQCGPCVNYNYINVKSKKAEILLNTECNNNCVFCTTTKKEFSISPEIIQKKIKYCSSKGIKQVELRGGEPTINKDLFNILKFINNTPLKITLRTNGRAFAYDSFVEKILRYPVSEFLIKLAAHTEELNKKLTCVVGAYNQTLKGIKKLIDLDQKVSLLIDINNINIKYMNEIVIHHSRLGVKKMVLSWNLKDCDHYTLSIIKNSLNYLSSTDISVSIQDLPVDLYGDFDKNLIDKNIKFKQ